MRKKEYIVTIGSANMDGRSFDLNFEINAVIYSKAICRQLSEAFRNDIEVSEELAAAAWDKRAWWLELIDDIARLLSPIL